MEQVTFKIEANMRMMLDSIAQEDDVSIGQILRSLVNKEISRRHNARPAVRTDEQLVAPLRARLATPLAHSSNWQELQDRLRQNGFELREAGGGLALYSWPAGLRVCKASELGFSYARLMRRLKAPFPDHSHSWLEAKHLQKDEADICLIERF